MDKSLRWLQSLQLCDSFFPVGAFSYSDGLEAAVDKGLVPDGLTLGQWMDTWIETNFCSFEGLALIQVRCAWEEKNWEQIQKIDEELTIMKSSSASRESSHSVGKRLIRSCLPLYPNQGLEEVQEKIKTGFLRGNLVTVYSIIFSILQLEEEEALQCYAYTRLTGMISAALRLMSVGQQEGQGILHQKLKKIPQMIQEILENRNQALTTFAPVVDISQMNHRFLYTRLFRS